MMEYNFYTKHSPKVSEIGLGAWQLGNSEEWSEMTDSKAVALVHKAIDEGINFFDTAPNYAGGNSERLIGKALKGKDRTKIVISTKFGHWPDGHTDFSAGKIRESVEGSLRRLDTDYLDSVLLHNPGRDIVRNDSSKHYEILEELKSEGKVLAYGASLDTAEEMTDFMSNTKGEVIEAFFNIIHQDARNAFDMAMDKGVGIIAKIPLDSGWLTGKYNKDSVFTGIRERWSPEDIKTRAEIVSLIRDMMPGDGSMAQNAIGFCLKYDAVSTVIPGCVNEKQLLENIKSIRFKPNASLIAELEELYEKDIKTLSLPW